jgi:hypothetical protein
MPAPLELLLDLAQLRPQPLLAGDALQQEPPVVSLRATVREAQKVEGGFRAAEAPLLTTLGGVPSELDRPRLLVRQLQAQLREPLTSLQGSRAESNSDPRS